MQHLSEYFQSTLKQGVLKSLGDQVRGTGAAAQGEDGTAAAPGQVAPQCQIKFCKFSQLYARDLLEMINASQNLKMEGLAAGDLHSSS